MTRRIAAVALAAALAAAAIATGARFRAAAVPTPSPVFARLGGDFAFRTAEGTKRLAAFRGRAVLLYFGYAHCPDACPAALHTIADALALLPERAQALGLFISVDPARDTPALLARYARFFSPKIVAGTVLDLGRLRRIAARFRAEFGYETPDGRPHPGTDYAVSHTSFIYLIAPSGRVVAMFDFRAAPGELARALCTWLGAAWARGGAR